MSGHPPIDVRAARRAFDRAAASAGSADFLARESESRMAERLDYLRIAPERILDLGCGTGSGIGLLAQRYPSAAIIGADFSLATLRAAAGDRGLGSRMKQWFSRASGAPLRGRLCTDFGRLPLASSSVSMIWSNLALAWSRDPAAAFHEFARVLEPGGLMMFSTYGPDTLRELRAAFAATDSHSHTLRFIDMHDLGDMMSASGFVAPVLDMHLLTLTYPDIDGLIRDLRATGATNVASNRRRGLLAPSGWRLMAQEYERLRHDGRLPASIELVFGHAWKGEQRAQSPRSDGRVPVRFDALEKRPPKRRFAS